jgi:hypothetical protein
MTVKNTILGYDEMKNIYEKSDTSANMKSPASKQSTFQ